VPETALCRDGACLALAEGECVDDGDCEEGSICVDPDLDGALECVEGAHECAVDDDCAALHPDCLGCTCRDADFDGLRECDCYGCGSLCTDDLDCAIHELCIEEACVFSGDDSCRMGRGDLDCPACFTCEPSVADPMRGTCAPLPDCG
jgi:hypothetical protein